MAYVNISLERSTDTLGKWSKVNVRCLKDLIGDKKKETHALNSSISPTSWYALKRVEKELEVLEFKEEKYWRQQS